MPRAAADQPVLQTLWVQGTLEEHYAKCCMLHNRVLTQVGMSTVERYCGLLQADPKPEAGLAPALLVLPGGGGVSALGQATPA